MAVFAVTVYSVFTNKELRNVVVAKIVLLEEAYFQYAQHVFELRLNPFLFFDNIMLYP